MRKERQKLPQWGLLSAILVLILSSGHVRAQAHIFNVSLPSACHTSLVSVNDNETESNRATVLVRDDGRSVPFAAFSHDYVSQTKLMVESDVYFGPVTVHVANQAELPSLRRRNLRLFLSCLQPGAVIYVHKKFERLFFDEVYPLISTPFVLVTGDNDDATRFTKHDKIIHWYGTHCEGAYDPKDFTCLPLGQSDNCAWAPSAIPSLINVTKEVARRDTTLTLHERPIDILVAFTTNTHHMRKSIRDLFCGETTPSTSTPYTHNNSVTKTSALCVTFRLDTTATMRLVAQSRFVISPHGHAPDCYRTWEALSLGAIPIVMRSSIDALFAGLPVLIVNSYRDVTPDLLARTLASVANTTYDFSKLTLSYWLRSFRSYGYPRHSYHYSDFVNYTAAAAQRLGLRDGDLIKGDEKLVYEMANGTRHAIPSLDVFLKHGWDFSNVRAVPELDLSEMEDGPDVS